MMPAGGSGRAGDEALWTSASARDDDARRTAALMGFIVILVLAIAGVVLVRELGDECQARGLPDVGPAQLRADRGPAPAALSRARNRNRAPRAPGYRARNRCQRS